MLYLICIFIELTKTNNKERHLEKLLDILKVHKQVVNLRPL
jgi:adenine C2-methylase RlmN of 23S rRNA A2503 and tRNA A37